MKGTRRTVQRAKLGRNRISNTPKQHQVEDNIQEENNNIGVNVFSADESLKVYPLKLAKQYNPINPFLWKNHYSVIKDMSRLVSAQISEGKRRKYICNRCLNAFNSDELLEKHLELCSDNDYQRHEYPELGSTTKFENYGKTQTVRHLCGF